jgi:hypothetical protein
LNHLKKLSPSPKTIEEFGKPPPVPLPFSGDGDREGDPFIQCPLPSSLVEMEFGGLFNYQNLKEEVHDQYQIHL